MCVTLWGKSFISYVFISQERGGRVKWVFYHKQGGHYFLPPLWPQNKLLIFQDNLDQLTGVMVINILILTCPYIKPHLKGNVCLSSPLNPMQLAFLVICSLTLLCLLEITASVCCGVHVVLKEKAREDSQLHSAQGPKHMVTNVDLNSYLTNCLAL